MGTKKRRKAKTKSDWPLSFYHKAYIIICGMLDCDMLYLDSRGRLYGNHRKCGKLPVLSSNPSNPNIICSMSKHAKVFMQKEIVKIIMNILLENNVYVNDDIFHRSYIKAGTKLETLVLDRDLEKVLDR